MLDISNSDYYEDKEFINWLNIHGYSTDVFPIKLDNALVEIVLLLLQSDFSKCNYVFEKISQDDAFKKSKLFLEENFKLHNILFADQEELYKKLETSEFSNSEELLKLLNDNTETISPFDLPISLSEGPSLSGEVNKFFIQVDDENYLKKVDVIFSEINLGDEITQITSTTYVHEVTHTQLDSIKGAIKNYLNIEIPSLFLEFVSALEFDKSKKLLKEIIRERMIMLVYQFQCLINYYDEVIEVDKRDAIEASKFIVSLLQVFKLFDIYINSNEIERNKMFEKIQLLFDGKITLKEILDDFDVNYDNSKDVNLLKKYM